jgi:AcrR family transcriptional regulator
MSRLPLAERRAQLVQAALAVAIRDGIEAATVRAVAAEAGVSLGVVHYCFDDKDELLREVGKAITTKNVRRIQFPAHERADARAALGAAFTGVWDSILENRGAQLLGFELMTTALRNPELRAVATVQLGHDSAMAEQVLTEVAARAGIEWTVPVGRLARLCVTSINGVALAWLIDDDDGAARAALGSFVEHVASYAGPVGGAVGGASG